MSRGCGNCENWHSTDRVWGDCLYASSPDKDGKKIAHATYVRRGDEHQAHLETRFNFRCILWASAAAHEREKV